MPDDATARRRRLASAGALLAAAVAAGCASASPAAPTTAPPPAPVLRAAGAAVAADLESWCRPGGPCATVTPAVGDRFAELSAPPRSNVVLDTGIDARTVTLDLSSPQSSETLRVVRPRRVDRRRWRFRLPSLRVLARIAVDYGGGANSRAVIFLRPRHA